MNISNTFESITLVAVTVAETIVMGKSLMVNISLKDKIEINLPPQHFSPHNFRSILLSNEAKPIKLCFKVVIP